MLSKSPPVNLIFGCLPKSITSLSDDENPLSEFKHGISNFVQSGESAGLTAGNGDLTAYLIANLNTDISAHLGVQAAVSN